MLTHCFAYSSFSLLCLLGFISLVLFSQELDAVTLHNQALMNMEANPTAVRKKSISFFFKFVSNSYIVELFESSKNASCMTVLRNSSKITNFFQGFEKLQFLLQQNPFPPGKTKYAFCVSVHLSKINADSCSYSVSVFG